MKATSEDKVIEVRPMAVVVLVLAFASVAYRLLVDTGLEQTALLFIGLPTMMGLMFSQAPMPRSATGVLMMTVTWVLLLSGIFFIEGVVCILIAAPLFYASALIIGGIADFVRRRAGRGRVNCCVGMVFVLMSFEGVTERLSFPRERSVEREFSVGLGAAEIEGRLARLPEFDLEARPGFFRIGFPQPVSVEGEGLTVGDRRVIHFAGGEGDPGDLVLEVAERGSGRVVFACVSDSSHIAHWLDWQRVTVRWEEGRASWRVEYKRLLDPAWYFAPMQDHAMRLAIGYLSESLLGEAGELLTD